MIDTFFSGCLEREKREREGRRERQRKFSFPLFGKRKERDGEKISFFSEKNNVMKELHSRKMEELCECDTLSPRKFGDFFQPGEKNNSGNNPEKVLTNRRVLFDFSINCVLR